MLVSVRCVSVANKKAQTKKDKHSMLYKEATTTRNVQYKNNKKLELESVKLGFRTIVGVGNAKLDLGWVAKMLQAKKALL